MTAKQKKSRALAAYTGACLCLMSLYLAGAGANHPFAWLFLAAVFGLASAAHFGAFDSRILGLMRALRWAGYLALGVCAAAIMAGGASEAAFLAFGGMAAGLMLICAVSEIYIRHFEIPR